jgi:thermitase
VAVSATNNSDTPPTWSNYGSYVDLSAPGENITTTWINNEYTTISGTPFASPIVAGAARLALARNPNLTNTQVVNLLLKSTDDIGAVGYDTYYGTGRINALKVTQNAAPTLDRNPPTTIVTNPPNNTSIAK